MKASWLTVYTLWKREMVRFFRQPSRVIGALGTPLVFWILLGSGFGTSFQNPAGGAQEGYLYYFFPGTILMIILFTSIFSTFSLIEDRREGFLQSVMVAPVSRLSIVLGKILGGATIAFLQSILFLLLTPLIGMPMTVAMWGISAGIIFLNAFALTALGFALAWKINSVQGFHAVMNIVLMPLWFLSGALFPADGAPSWVQGLIKINPLTYGMSALRQAMTDSLSGMMPSWQLSLGILLLFSVFTLLLSVVIASDRTAENISS